MDVKQHSTNYHHLCEASNNNNNNNNNKTTKLNGSGDERQELPDQRKAYSSMYSAHTPSIAFRHLPPKLKQGCRKPVLGVCQLNYPHLCKASNDKKKKTFTG